MIGGATTSRAHTALKIDPHYKSPTIWVKDASRAVGVAQSLVSPELRVPFVAATESDYAEIRQRHRNRGDAKRLVSLEKARAQRFDGGWDAYVPPPPAQPGLTVFDDYPIADLVDTLDWTLSRPGSWPGASRPSWTTAWSARPRASCTATRARCSTPSSATAG